MISDSTGVTGQSAVARAFSQFVSCSNDLKLTSDSCEVKTSLFSHVEDEATIAGVLKKGSENPSETLIVYTLSDVELRTKTRRMCELSGLNSVDLMGPLLDSLGSFFNEAPMGTPGGRRGSVDAPYRLSDNYYKRIDAVEFTLKADDGSAPWLLAEADVVIVGVSRTGKTPLSVIMAQQMGLKVANVPLVLECAPPKELFDSDKLDSSKVFCLTIEPTELKRIRTTRLERSNVKSFQESRFAGADTDTTGKGKSNYADRNYLLRDLKNARDLATERGWTEIDVTGRAVEETAGYISELLSKRRSSGGGEG